MATYRAFFRAISKSIVPLLIFLFFFFLLAPSDANAASKIPQVRLSVQPLDLDNLTVEGIMAAGQFGGQLYPTEDIIESGGEDEDNHSFAKAMQEWNDHNYKEAALMLKQHLKDHPDSPWASEAMLHLGCDAQYNGRYSEAEEYFNNILAKDKDNQYEGARKMVNKATLRLGVLKVYQNNFDEAKRLFSELIKSSDDWRDHTYGSHWIQRLSRYTADKRAMLNCGTLALASILEKQGKAKEAMELRAMKPNTGSGYSMQDLKEIASKYGYDVIGLRVSQEELDRVPLPAIAHLSGRSQGDGGHYWVLDKVVDGTLHLFDPQAGRWFHLTEKEFGREWEGNILVFQTGGDPIKIGVKLSESEMESFCGGCCGTPRPEDDLGCNDNKGPRANPSNGPCGAPTWSVNMVNMNLFVTDTPLWYENPIGPSVEISLSYNSQSAIAQYVPFGQKWQFNYCSYLVEDSNKQVTIFMPDGRRDVYPPNGNNYSRPFGVFNTLTKTRVQGKDIYELRFPDDTVYTYTKPQGTQQDVLTKITDRYGQSLTLGYNNGQLTTITDALSTDTQPRVTTLTYTNGLVTQVTDPFGRSASFTYNGNNLVGITDMGGYATTLSYDSNVYLTSIGNSRGTWQFYIEPADGIDNGSNDYPAPGGTMWQDYRITVTNPLGGKEEYHYTGNTVYGWYVSPKFYNPYVSSSNNNYALNVSRNKYYYTTISGKGRISRVEYPDGGKDEFTYDSLTGEQATAKHYHDGTVSHTVSYAYNGMGRVNSVTDAKQKTTTMTYATNAVDMTGMTNGLGTISMGYNGFHNMTTLTDRLNKTTHYTYNGYGQVTRMTDALGNATNYTYYDAGSSQKYRLQNVTRNGKTLFSFTYDAKGRVQTRTDPTGLMLTCGYNNLDQVTSLTYPDGKQETYVYSSCCPRLIDSYTDRSGRTTYYTYDSLKRLIETKRPDSTLIKYEYDASGNMSKLTDTNSNLTRFVYDYSINRLARKIYADWNCETYSYDYEGLLTSKTNARGIKATYNYDENHNLTGITYSDSTPSVSYAYDDYNRLTSRTDGIGTWGYTYDANSRLKTVKVLWDTATTLTYSYDNIGRRTSLQQQGGETINCSYNVFGNMSAISAGTRFFRYSYTDANPIPDSLTRRVSGANKSITSYVYDALKRLTSISNKKADNTVITANAFTYNSLTNVDMRDSETITNGQPMASLTNNLVAYNYNAVNQLTSSTSPNRTYAYDADGNMTSFFTPDGYTATATYDAENRLKTITYTDSNNVQHGYTFYYSGDGLLAKQVIDGIETRFVRDGYLCLQERDGSNAVNRSYVWDPDAPGGIGGLLELTQGGQHYNYLFDGKGNVSTLIDANQNAVASYRYDPFGVLMSKSGTLDQPYMFSTKLYYSSIGVVKYDQRDYLPPLGRWGERDLLGEKADINLYRAMGNSPNNFIDPYGFVYGTGVIGGITVAAGVGVAMVPGCQVVGAVIAGVGVGLILYEVLTLPDDMDNAVDTARKRGFDDYFKNLSTNCNRR